MPSERPHDFYGALIYWLYARDYLKYFLMIGLAEEARAWVQPLMMPASLLMA